MAFGTDENGGDGFVPQIARSAPAGGHGVESPVGTGGHEHPFAADDVDRIVGDAAGVDGFHGNRRCYG